MKKIIELNANDIRKLIAKEYGIDEKKITWEYSEDQDDGFYMEPANVIFSFEEATKNE